MFWCYWLKNKYEPAQQFSCPREQSEHCLLNDMFNQEHKKTGGEVGHQATQACPSIQYDNGSSILVSTSLRCQLSMTLSFSLFQLFIYLPHIGTLSFQESAWWNSFGWCPMLLHNICRYGNQNYAQNSSVASLVCCTTVTKPTHS